MDPTFAILRNKFPFNSDELIKLITIISDWKYHTTASSPARQVLFLCGGNVINCSTNITDNNYTNNNNNEASKKGDEGKILQITTGTLTANPNKFTFQKSGSISSRFHYQHKVCYP